MTELSTNSDLINKELEGMIQNAPLVKHIEIFNQVKLLSNLNYIATHGRSVLPTFFIYKVTIIC